MLGNSLHGVHVEMKMKTYKIWQLDIVGSAAQQFLALASSHVNDFQEAKLYLLSHWLHT